MPPRTHPINMAIEKKGERKAQDPNEELKKNDDMGMI